MTRFAVIRLYDPILKNFNKPTVMTFNQVMKLQTDRKVMRVGRFCDSKEEAIRFYWRDCQECPLIW
jgi:hypothetical protein